MARRNRSVPTKLLTLILALVTPLAQAQNATHPNFLNTAMDVHGKKGIGQPVWDYLAAKVYEDEDISLIPAAEREELSRYFFADYLGYINAIGVELASFENSLTARREIR